MIAHGTPRGFHEGCKTRVGCPAVIPCRDVYIRYQGDLTFRRAIDAGTPLEDILAADEAAAAADVEAEKAARRAASPTPAPRLRKRKPVAPRQRFPWTREDDATLRTFAGTGRHAIADVSREMNRPAGTVRSQLIRLGLTLPDGRALRYSRGRS